MIQLFLIVLYGLFLACSGKKETKAPGDSNCFSCAQAPPGTIFCDDFEDELPLQDKYFEYNSAGGKFTLTEKAGRGNSRGMKVQFSKGDVDVGWLKKSIGRTPDAYIGKNAVRPEEDFNEIYWRVDIKRQEGWKGGGADKLSRATVMANSNWAQGAIGHIWSNGNALMIDPASGITAEGVLVSTKYNDFPNLRWNLGKKVGTTPLFNDENAGKWFCVEGHMRLNTPGESDGLFEFWIDDVLQARTTNMNWHGRWNADPDHYKINAVFFENYWNNGSVQDQERYMDNIVISTQRIGCACRR